MTDRARNRFPADTLDPMISAITRGTPVVQASDIADEALRTKRSSDMDRTSGAIDTAGPDDDAYALHAIRTDGAKRWVIAFTRANRRVSLSFSHKVYGGEDPARTVAIACRDAALAALRPMSNRQVRTTVRKNRLSGIPGVYHIKATARQSASWAAVTYSNGRSIRRYFSIARHGDIKARRLAEEARACMLDEIENIDGAALRKAEALRLEESLNVDSAESSMKGIVREVDQWCATAQLGRRRLRQRFIDVTCGGEATALAVACAWRDAVSRL